MKLLGVSDLHGEISAVWAAIEVAQPDVLLCCGDWGDPEEISPRELTALAKRLPVYTVFGNHDDLDFLSEWRNSDGSSVLLQNGKVVKCGNLHLAGINGIWAKSHRKPYYVTDADVDEAVIQIMGAGKQVDILLSHGCPRGIADLTWDNRRGGQACFLRAFQAVRPSVYLTGHLHRPQAHMTAAKQTIRNVGVTPRGHAVLLEVCPDGLCVSPLTFAG